MSLSVGEEQKGSTPVTPGRTDAERIRRPRDGAARRKRGRPAAAADVPVTQPEEREFWGRQVQGFWNNLAAARGYAPIPDEQVSAIGEPAALTAKKYLKDAQEEHPEYLLLFVLTPYIMGAIRVEWERWTRRAAAPRRSEAGVERGDIRAEGGGEDDSDPPTPATRPFTLSDS